jgi:RNA polymerase-associated protein CTR9
MVPPGVVGRAKLAFCHSRTEPGLQFEAVAELQAMHIQPSDRAILYNIAMIQQKAAEMLLSLEPSKRTLEELQAAVLQARHAAKYVHFDRPADVALIKDRKS